MKFTDLTLADVSTDTKVETLGVVLDQTFSQIEDKVSNITKLQGPQGVKGDKGDKGATGPQGIAGKDGKEGKDGKAGAAGKDGVDGDDGVSVVDAKIDFDSSLVLTLSNGNEIDCGQIIGPDNAQSIVINSGGSGTSQAITDAVKNLVLPTNPTFTYTSGILTSIAYGSGESKTFTYTNGLLTRLDFIRNGVTIRKTFNYTSGVLASITQVTL
jgi:hypothetical protein